MIMNVISSESDPLIAIRQQADALVALADALDIPRSHLADKETLDSVVASYTVTSTCAIAWEIGMIASNLQQFGADAELLLATRGADPTFDMPQARIRGDQVGESDIHTFIEGLQAIGDEQGNEIYVDISLSVRKSVAQGHLRRLLSQQVDWHGSDEVIAQTKVVLCFQSLAWQKWLTLNALWSWESKSLLTHGQRLVVALCDAEGYLGGPAIDILGVKSGDLPLIPTVSRQAWVDFLECGAAMHSLYIQESNWGIGPLTITPEHFDLHELRPGLSAVAEDLSRMQAALSAAYLANSVQLNPSQEHVVLGFAGPRPSQLNLPHGSDRTVIQGEFSQHALFDLTMWAYRHGSPDKLLIARECLARELPARTPVDLKYVESHARETLDAAESNFIQYVRGNTSQYFELRQQAVDAVTTYAEGVERTVSGMTSDLVSNVYKVAGLLAGAIAAVLIEPSVTVQVLILSIVVQVLYVLFNIFYALPAQKRRYEADTDRLNRRLSVMDELSTRERESIRATAMGADSDFEKSYSRARTLYWWMCGACIIIGLVMAVVLHNVNVVVPPLQGVLTPTPLATGTPAK